MGPGVSGQEALKCYVSSTENYPNQLLFKSAQEDAVYKCKTLESRHNGGALKRHSVGLLHTLLFVDNSLLTGAGSASHVLLRFIFPPSWCQASLRHDGPACSPFLGQQLSPLLPVFSSINSTITNLQGNLTSHLSDGHQPYKSKPERNFQTDTGQITLNNFCLCIYSGV